MILTDVAKYFLLPEIKGALSFIALRKIKFWEKAL
jgi:hypothetical protein